jgi:hypothetical protein
LTTPTPSAWTGFLLAIREMPNWVDKTDWVQSFIAAGEARFDKLEAEKFDPDGQLYAGREIHGRYQFVDVHAVQEAFPHSSWLTLEPPCPWVGPVRGFLNWEWWTPSIEARRYDAERFIGTSRGYIVRLRDGKVWEGVRQNEHPLAAAQQKHGFDDGVGLLDQNNAYQNYVWQTIVEKLAELGLNAKQITYGTSHNRFRFDELVSNTPEAWRRFEAHKADVLKIWSQNNDIKSLISLIEAEEA